ncbi:MAG: type II toxin-antitoxin system VapC family toxin [Gemmatimonadota bacterium]
MRLLLDTSTFILWHAGALKPAPVRALRRASQVFVSSVTAVEISLKTASGKLRLGRSVDEAVAAYGFTELPLTVRHGDRLAQVPSHHRDPFDRLLIAQAIEEGLTILTSDRVFELYQVSVEWA